VVFRDSQIQHVPRCPRGCEALVNEALGPIVLRSCPTCKGAWMTVAALDRPVVGSMIVHLPEAPTGIFDASPRLFCPECGRMLLRRTLREQVTVDVCGEHGVWFDAGELRVLAEARWA
jgi:Zn-finger nucleic acid-binding protein